MLEDLGSLPPAQMEMDFCKILPAELLPPELSLSVQSFHGGQRVIPLKNSKNDNLIMSLCAYCFHKRIRVQIMN